MIKWSDVSNLLGNVNSKIGILNGSSTGSILVTQSIVNQQTQLMNTIGTPEALNNSVTSLNDAVNSNILYLSSLGNGSMDSKVLSQIQDKLNNIKIIYNNYVTAYNNYNNPAGNLQSALTKLINEVNDLADYTEVDISSLVDPTHLVPDTLTQLNRSSDDFNYF
jgi:DNA repair ATPase RecN